MLTEILNAFSDASCLQDIHQNISPITKFLPRKVFFVQRFHDCCWHPKLARFRFSGWSGQTGQTSRTIRSDKSRKVCQIINWTTPLRRTRRYDRKAYMERPSWSPDKEVMPPGRPAPRSDWSDRSRGGQTSPEIDQTGLKRPIRVRSCILTRDLLGFQLLMGTDLPVLYIWRATADWG